MNGSELALKIEAYHRRQTRALCGYSDVRTYTLVNRHMSEPARMQVDVSYRKGEHKQFKVLSIEGSGIARRSLLDLLHSETESEGYGSPNSTLSPENYNLQVLGTERCGSIECYKVRMIPKRRTEYLLEGTALIAATDYHYVQVTGTMSKSPSFWLSKPVVEQRFEEIDGFRMPSYNFSKTHVLFLGDADLTITYGPYHVERCPDAPPRE